MAARKALSIRAMNRERITTAILDTARNQIATQGASGLSLRAVSRELGMASSAIYRYFPSRDELLTQLIIDAYDALGAAVERGETEAPRADLAARFRAICISIRSWALQNQHEYFLIYGSPVPGYKAPDDTIVPATRVANLMIGVLVEAAMARPAKEAPPMPSTGLQRALKPMRQAVPVNVPDADLATGLRIFSSVFGAISFELGGQLHNVITDTKASRAAYFESQVDAWLSELGL